jgi:hypothetical protein
MAGMGAAFGMPMGGGKDAKSVRERRAALARVRSMKGRETDTPTGVFGGAVKALMPDPEVLRRAANDPVGTAQGAAEIISLVSPAANIYRGIRMATGRGFGVAGGDMEDVEQAVEVAGIIPTGKTVTGPLKVGLDVLDYGVRGAARRTSSDMLSAASGGIVRGVPKPVRQTRKKVATSEDINQAAWGDPMGAPRGTGERRLNPEGRRGTPRFYRGQQGLGNAEYPIEIPTDAADRAELAAELGTSVDDLDSTVKRLNTFSEDVYKQNRGVGDDPVIVSVEQLATPETMKEVISKSTKRYGTLTDEQIKDLTDRINKDILDSPGTVWRMKDVEDRLMAYTAIHHGDTPFWVGGAGKPEEWSGIPNRLNSFFGARGK